MGKFTSTDKQNITSRLFAFCLLIGTLMFMDSCRDATELDIPVPAPETENTRAELQTVDNPDGLIQQPDRTWKAVGKRVPLVGVGRVVNSFGSPLLEVIDGQSDNFGKIVDTDIDNYTSFTTSGVSASLASVNLVSVRDIYRTYAGGQQAGFVLHFEETANLLSLDLLKNMEIHFYKDGYEQAFVKLVHDEGQTAVGLKLLAFDNGNNGKEQALSVTCPSDKSFDEIQLVINGTNLSLFSSGIDVKYAFVGDNEDKIAATNHNADFWENNFPVVNTDRNFTTNELKNLGGIIPDVQYVPIDGYEKIVDYEIDNSLKLSTGSLLGGSDQYITVNFQKEIPAGYEVGFLYSIDSSILGLNLLGASGPDLYTYDSNGDETGSQGAKTSLLSLDLLNSNKGQMRAGYTLEKPSSQVKIKATDGFFNLIGKLPILGDLIGGKKSIYVYYAYVREPVTVDVSSYFSIDDTEIYKSDYELPASSDEGNVYYNMITQPYGANATVSGNTLTGATKEGAYVIQAIYTDNKTGKQVSHVFTIYRRTSTSAGSGSKYITNASHGAYPSEPLNNDGGCLLCLFNNVNSLNAIVDNNLDNYAVYTQVLGLAENTPLAAIELTKPVNSVLKDIRTGFVVQANSGLLDVSLLNNLEIRLYNNGELIETGNAASTGTDVLGVDLISGGNDKFRVYVNTDQQFDRIELWAKQGVGLSLFNNFRMYGVFYEDADEKQTSANEVCMEVMNNLNHRLEIDYDRTGESGGLGNVNLLGGTTYGLSNLLDNDLNTGMSVSSLLKLELLNGDLQVALKFKEMPVSRPIGVVLEADGGLLGSNLTALGNNVSVSILSDGQEICKAQKASVLDLNLLESEKRIYFELIPEYNLLEDGVSADYYDGIVISLGGGLLDLSLNEIKVTGIYTRVDSDGDGIPDCVDTEGEEANITITDDAHTCEGEPLVIPIETDAVVGSEYLLSFENLTSGGKYDKVVAVSESDGAKAFSVDGLPYGKYDVDVVSLGSGDVLVRNAKAYVHAQLTEWMGKNDTDWNNWGNWTKGAPWHCTDVIIRKDAMKYPELKSGVTNCCDRIHFEAGAMLVRSDLLTYYKAFVDVQLKGGEYNYFVSPLQATVTGDMFINPTVSWTKDKYFTMPDAGNYPQMRTSPVVYQQASVKAYDFDGNGNKPVSDVIDDEFTQDFNGVNHQYSEAALYKVKPGDDTGASYCFRLPKDYNEYDYFSPNGVSKNLKETITRTGTVGQLFTEDFSTVSKYHTAFIPNPYMSYIMVEIPEGATVRSYSDGTYYTIGNVGGSKISTGDDIIILGSSCYIPPMSGIVVETNMNTDLRFDISPEMQCAKPEEDFAPAATRNSRTSATAVSEPHGVLRVVAEKDERWSSCVLYRSAEASNSLKEGEDVRTMVDAIEAPVVAVYSMADGKAADIQQFSDSEQINLGLIVRRSGTVKLKFKHDGSWDDWYLLDRQTSRVYFLNEAVEVVLENATSGNNRLSLIKK